MQTKPKAKRIKRVFSSSYEVFHMWAAQTQSDARQGGRITRTFFEGDSCYSYGRHYKVGKLVTIKGHTIALINRDGYSHTTAKHISEASSAVSHLPKIDVDGTFDWRAGLKEMRAKLANELERILRGRKFYKGYRVFDKYQRERFESFNKTCKLVGLSKLQLKPSKAYLKTLQAHVNARIKREAELRSLQETPEYQAKRERAKARKGALLAAKNQAEIDSWKRGGSFTPAVKDAFPQLMRIKDGMIETSRRAHVGLETAKSAFRALQTGKLKPGTRIGEFEFRGVDLDGDLVKVGCHTFSLAHVCAVLETESQSLPTLQLVHGGKQ